MELVSLLVDSLDTCQNEPYLPISEAHTYNDLNRVEDPHTEPSGQGIEEEATGA